MSYVWCPNCWKDVTVKLKTIDGRETVLKPEALDDLRRRLRGRVLEPSDAGYDDSRTV